MSTFNKETVMSKYFKIRREEFKDANKSGQSHVRIKPKNPKSKDEMLRRLTDCKAVYQELSEKGIVDPLHKLPRVGNDTKAYTVVSAFAQLDEHLDAWRLSKNDMYEAQILRSNACVDYFMDCLGRHGAGISDLAIMEDELKIILVDLDQPSTNFLDVFEILQ